MNIRMAREEELDRVNELRRQVSELHAAGQPDVFRPGFPQALRDYIHLIWGDPEKEILVAEQDGRLCGFAILHEIRRPESPSKQARAYLDIDEFGVDEACRRQGVATAMMAAIRDHARARGLRRIELNMWEFNQDALAFYEAAGFSTYRRYMELSL